MKKAIAFHLSSWDELERWENHEKISPNPEDYQRCVARQFWNEVQTCKKLAFPYFFLIKDQKAVVAHNRHLSENVFLTRNSFEVFTEGGSRVEDLRGREVLLRCDVPNVKKCIETLTDLGASVPVSKNDIEKIDRWYRSIGHEWTKRNMVAFPLDDVERDPKSAKRKLADVSRKEKVFVKFHHKSSALRAGVYDTEEAFYLLMTASLTMGGSEVIAAEPMDLLVDMKGKCEYRFFVVGGQITSASRYIDYETDYEIPETVCAFARSFVSSHGSALPKIYVLDVGIDAAAGPLLVELNDAHASGRYEKNSFASLIEAL